MGKYAVQITILPVTAGKIWSVLVGAAPDRWPSGLRSVCRRLLARLLILSTLLLAAFLFVTLYFSYRYSATLSETAPVLVRATALMLIRAATSLYDPCAARVAELGPPPSGAVDVAKHIRAEDFFHSVHETPAADCGGQIRILEVDNPSIVRSRFPFRYQPYDEPRLHQLRAKYHLDEVIKGASSEFEGMVLLRSWARSQFRRRDYQPATPNFDALEVLDRNLRNTRDEPMDLQKHLDPCHFFPLFYCHIMLAMGHTARLVSIGHGMAEVWSNQFNKWVSMDAELDHHYEKNGIPLNMLEMHDENFVSSPSRVRIVRGHQWSGDPNTTMVHLGVEELPVINMIRYHLRQVDIVDMRNDWLTNHYFPGHPHRSEHNSLSYDDPRVPVSMDIRHLLRPRSNRKEDLSWTLNQTEIWIEKESGADCLRLVFKTVTPNFAHFELRVDGGEAMDCTSDTYGWRLHEGENSLSVMAVNKFGIKGISSAIRLRKTVRESSE